jgi:hypothetical protein
LTLYQTPRVPPDAVFCGMEEKETSLIRPEHEENLSSKETLILKGQIWYSGTSE